MEYLRLAVEILKVVAWPAVVIYVLLAYREPLRRIIVTFPKKLEQTSKFSFGSLVFEMQATLTKVGDPALARELPRLSRAAYEQVLALQGEDAVLSLVSFAGVSTEHGFEHGIELAGADELAVALELERVGLIESREPLKDFIKFAKSLPQSPQPGEEGTWISEGSISDEQKTRLQMSNCTLTPRGRKLYEVIIGVVLSSLTTEDGHAQA